MSQADQDGSIGEDGEQRAPRRRSRRLAGGSTARTERRRARAARRDRGAAGGRPVRPDRRRAVALGDAPLLPARAGGGPARGPALRAGPGRPRDQPGRPGRRPVPPAGESPARRRRRPGRAVGVRVRPHAARLRQPLPVQHGPGDAAAEAGHPVRAGAVRRPGGVLRASGGGHQAAVRRAGLVRRGRPAAVRGRLAEAAAGGGPPAAAQRRQLRRRQREFPGGPGGRPEAVRGLQRRRRPDPAGLAATGAGLGAAKRRARPDPVASTHPAQQHESGLSHVELQGRAGGAARVQRCRGGLVFRTRPQGRLRARSPVGHPLSRLRGRAGESRSPQDVRHGGCVQRSIGSAGFRQLQIRRVPLRSSADDQPRAEAEEGREMTLRAHQ